MTLLVLVWLAVLAVLIVVQSYLSGWFAIKVARAANVARPTNYCPPVAVVLCVRGLDPSLPACLAGLMSLDYPDYQIHIVADNEMDPAVEVVRQATQAVETGFVTLSFLKHPSSTCSLKCSSLVQTIKGLTEKIEAIALIDADTIPHQSWLRELVAPLAEENVAAATGTRWYMPRRAAMGSLARYLWNAGAVVIMASTNIAWGGTLAIKRSAVSKAGLLERWSESFCEEHAATSCAATPWVAAGLCAFLSHGES